MRKFLFLFTAIIFIVTSVFSQPGAPYLDLEWESVSTPNTATATGFAEKDGRMWIANGDIYFSDDEGLNWERHPDLISTTNTSYYQVFTTVSGVTVVVRNENSQGILFSNNNGDTFNTGGLEWSYTIDPNGPGSGGPYGFFQKSATELIGIYHDYDELLGESYLVARSLDAGETFEIYSNVSYGSLNNQQASLDRHNYITNNDTIADLIKDGWVENSYRLNPQ